MAANQPSDYESGPVEALTASPGPDGKRGRILVVDDERHNRELLQIMLTPEGFAVSTAVSGEQALAMVAQDPPDLILLDVRLPGMDGYQVAARIKDNLATKKIPIIIITGLEDRGARMLGLRAGAEDFLTTPVDRDELGVRVRNLLRLKAYSDEQDTYNQTLEGEVDSRTADLVERTKSLEEQAAILGEQAALLDLAEDAIVVCDLHNRILFWNSGAETMYGWRRDEALGKSSRELLRTEFSEPAAAIQATLLGQGRWDGEATQVTRAGKRLTVASRWTLQRDSERKPTRILTIDSDITERKQAESERVSLTERLSLATAVAKLGVWDWDLASDTLTWDATMFDIYGLAPVVSMPYETWSAAVSPGDLPAVEATLHKTIAEKGQGASEFSILRSDGSVRHVSASERVVLDEDGNVSRLIGVNMDVTERKDAEQALEQGLKDQVRFKDEFLSHVSHELRSPLTAIKQFSAILLGGLAGDLTTEQHEYQAIVLRNVRQLQSMIDDLLEVTRLETGRLTVEIESVSVSDALTDTFDTLQGTANAKGVALSSDLSPDLPAVHADPTRLRQILIILLDNAVKFTPGGGGVRVHARLLPLDPEFLLIEVSDDGCGISPEVTERIFERLYQISERTETSRKGLGLGLYICKELVTRQGGEIWVQSRPQLGSTFSFTLPVFSLKNLMTPLLKNGRWPADFLALIVVRIGRLDAWPSRAAQEQWSSDARTLIQRCLLPDLDVLLPQMSHSPNGDRFLAAAFADERGAGVLAARIREQFERHGNLKQSQLTLSVSHHMLPPFQRDAGPSPADSIATMTTNLEESIRIHLIQQAVMS